MSQKMDGTDIRKWYDEQYHYGEDVETTQWGRINKVVAQVPKGNIETWLDLGGGTGTATAAARKAGLLDAATRAIVFDLSSQALLTGKTEWPDLSMVQGDGQALPFRDRYFDRVFCFGVLEHFPDVEAGACEIGRVLADDGYAVVIVPNWWVRTRQSNVSELVQSAGKWKGLFSRAGLATIDRGVDRGPEILKNKSPLGIFKRIVLRAAGYIPGLEYQFVFVLRKKSTAPKR